MCNLAAGTLNAVLLPHRMLQAAQGLLGLPLSNCISQSWLQRCQILLPADLAIEAAPLTAPLQQALSVHPGTAASAAAGRDQALRVIAAQADSALSRGSLLDICLLQQTFLLLCVWLLWPRHAYMH